MSLVAGIAAALVLSIGLGPANAAPSAGGCQLKGTANFSPGLGSTAQNFTYNFGGALTGCQSSVAGAPTSGTVSAGQTLTYKGVAYTEPFASGNGGCSNSTTQGTAFITWADGTLTIISYSTTGAAAAVALQGSVVASVQLKRADGTSTDPIATSRYSGASVLGLLAFQPPSPTDCTTATGVTTAGISGVTGLGSSSS